MKTAELTKVLPKNHLMPTKKYGCIEYSDWCRAEIRRINQDPTRNVFFMNKGSGKDMCCIGEMVKNDKEAPAHEV